MWNQKNDTNESICKTKTDSQTQTYSCQGRGWGWGGSLELADANYYMENG